MAELIVTPITNPVESTKIEAVALEPIRVTMIGSPRNADAPSEQLITTPAGHRDVLVKFVTPLRAITLRFLYAYFTALVGLVTAASTTNIIPTTDFLDLLVKSATLSLAGPAVNMLKDFIFVLGKAKERWPLGDV